MGLMTRKLRRVPGRTIVVNVGIVPSTSTPKTPKADPNGYYEVLGLDPAEDWSSTEIKRAYWTLAKRYHPDGSSPDRELFRRVQLAYGVLKEPESRDKYDSLDDTQRWIDEDVIATIIRGVIKPEDRDKAMELLKSQLITEKPMVLEKGVEFVPAPPGKHFSSFAYYHYEGEDVPTLDVREAWAEALMQVMLDRGLHGEVHLGFTTGRRHIVAKLWGEVLMASGSPSTQAAVKLLELSEVQRTRLPLDH